MAKVMFSSGSRAWANNLNDLRERWNIRREEPVRFVVPVDLFKQDVSNLSRDDLNSLHADLLKLLNAGKKELLKAKNQSRYEGIRLEPDEYSDLLYTVKTIGTHIEEIKNAISVKKRKEQTEKDSKIERRFINVAKKVLPEELFWKIIEEARDGEEE